MMELLEHEILENFSEARDLIEILPPRAQAFKRRAAPFTVHHM